MELEGLLGQFLFKAVISARLRISACKLILFMVSVEISGVLNILAFSDLVDEGWKDC